MRNMKNAGISGEYSRLHKFDKWDKEGCVQVAPIMDTKRRTGAPAKEEARAALVRAWTLCAIVCHIDNSAYPHMT